MQTTTRAYFTTTASHRVSSHASTSSWLRSAIRDGSTGGLWEGGFPRYAWHKEAATVFEARLVDRGDGSYKGYPLHDEEWPPHMVDSQ